MEYDALIGREAIVVFRVQKFMIEHIIWLINLLDSLQSYLNAFICRLSRGVVIVNSIICTATPGLELEVMSTVYICYIDNWSHG